MPIRKIAPNTELHVGQIVMTQGVLTHGLCGWPCKISVINKTRLTLERLRPKDFDSDHRALVKYAKAIAYIADTEEEAFAFYEAAMEHAKRAHDKQRKLEAEIREEGHGVVAKYVTGEEAK